MSYEAYRTEIASLLLEQYNATLSSSILEIIDKVSTQYDVKRKQMELIVATDAIPQIVKYYIASKAVENKSRHTINAYKQILTKFFNAVQIPFDTVSANDIRTYLFDYKQRRKVQDSTIDRVRSCLHGFYEWCVQEERINRNPVRKIGVIKHQKAKREPLTQLELETLRNGCRTLREKALVDFLYSTACRVSEFCALRIEDIDFNTKTVRILHGKGDKARLTYINAESEVSLKMYLESRTDDCEMLFVSNRKPAHGITTRAVEDELKRIAGRTIIKRRIYPHILRHTAATIAIRSGMPVEQVQQFLGHSNINTTMIYAKIDEAEIRASHRKYIA